jgi:hypothetical protein
MSRVKKADLDSADAFLPDPRSSGRPIVRDALAELVGDNFVSSATAGEAMFDDARNAFTADELRGPFIEVDGREELSIEPDASNLGRCDKRTISKGEPHPTGVDHYPRFSRSIGRA